MRRVGMPSRRSSVIGSNLMSSTIFIPLLIVNRGTIFHRYDKSNELEIITRDAGARERGNLLRIIPQNWSQPLFLFLKRTM